MLMDYGIQEICHVRTEYGILTEIPDSFWTASINKQLTRMRSYILDNWKTWITTA
jgi:hypothetical protein